MKKLLGFIIFSGFVLMLGVAGSADFANMSFSKVLVLELLGVAIVLSGTSALMHYKRYLRRHARMHRKNAACRIRMVEKELC